MWRPADLVSREEHLNKGNTETEDQPDVDHLDIGGGGEVPGNTDEQGEQGQDDGHVDTDGSVEEGRLLVVEGGVANDVEQECREEDGHDDGHGPPSKSDDHSHALLAPDRSCYHAVVHDIVGGKIFGAGISQNSGNQHCTSENH